MRKKKIEGQMTFDFSFSMELSVKEDLCDSMEQKIETAHNDKEIIVESGKNYYDQDIDFGKTLNDKLERNISAIRLIKDLQKESRNASFEEQKVLSKYEGWGNLSLAFQDEKKRKLLKNLLTEEEFFEVKSSVLTSYYTPSDVIDFIYHVLKKMGVDGQLNILEPSMGTGHFYQLLPSSMRKSQLYGVELESVSGQIAKQLYPEAKIHITGFETADLKDNFFDLIVGNVPFGNYFCSDTTYGNLSIHDYFFIKALDLARPGGIIAMITTRETMDKTSKKLREQLAKRATLVKAYRLPNTVFEHTSVTADILFFQKDEYAKECIDGIEWMESDKYNKYFITHSENIFGTMGNIMTKFGERLTCNPDRPLAQYFIEALLTVPKVFTAIERSDESGEETEIIADDTIKNMSFGISNDKVYYRTNSTMRLIEQGMREKRIRGMIKLRTVLYDLIDAEQTAATDDQALKKQRQWLNIEYDQFVAKYGLIHSRGNKLAFQEDASYYLLCTLEILDEDKNFKTKADIMKKRCITPYIEPSNVMNAKDALLLSMSEKGCIDFEYMQSLYEKTFEEIIQELKGWIFKNPETGKYEMKDLYLCGNVKRKLQIAKDAAESGNQYLENVYALEKVQPAWIPASEIDARLGAVWIPVHFIEDFIVEEFQAPRKYFENKYMKVEYYKEMNRWEITWRADSSNSRITKTYGTDRLNGYELLEKALNLKDAKIYKHIKRDDKEIEVVDKEATVLAMGKQEEIREAFKSWIYRDYSRRVELERIYNEKINVIRNHEYDGSFLKFPYKNQEIDFLKTQKDAIMRILFSEQNALIAHKVGYRKTFIAIASIMEARRLGISKKNLIVVPNSLVEQWGEEFLRLYPSANILVAGEKDFSPSNRKMFCSKIATCDYDAVIITYSQFTKIPISESFQEKYIKKQLNELENLTEEARQNRFGRNGEIRGLEAAKKRLKVQLSKLRDQKNKDDTIYFEQLGITKLYVDEAHNFKNLFINTKMNNLAGLNTSVNSKRAFDMFLKCRYLDETNERKSIVFLTGTPVSNSMAEIYTMQRYLQYDMIEEMGLLEFDSWASVFGEIKTTMELSPEGSGYRSQTRFYRFIGLPELIKIFREVADIKVAEIKSLNLPKAEYTTISIEASKEQRKYVQMLGERAECIHSGGIDPEVDNMLKITHEGRMLALDQRLVGIRNENLNSKAENCTDIVKKIYDDHPGKTQAIFCDISTPKKEFNVYDDLKVKLIQKGIAAEEIAFIQDAKNNKQKIDLCKKVDSGKVRVLIASTEKGGTGCNYQSRLIAIHDLDCPWRPSDLEQRSGRIIRQGNSNEKVYIYRYVTKNTFDSYLWQTIEHKQRYISQILTEKDIPRRMEEDESTISYAEIKAAACGNPEIKEQMQLSVDVQRLKMQKANFTRQYCGMQDYVNIAGPNRIATYKDIIEKINMDLGILNETEDCAFNMRLFDRYDYDIEKEANKTLKGLKGSWTCNKKIGAYRGFDIILKEKNSVDYETIILKANFQYAFDYISGHADIVLRIKKILSEIPYYLSQYRTKLQNEERQFETAKKELLNDQFPKEDELREKELRLNELNLKLSA